MNIADGCTHQVYCDVADSYIEKVSKKDNELVYEYDEGLKPVGKKEITLRYLDNGKLSVKKITTYYTHTRAGNGQKKRQLDNGKSQ